MLWLQEDRISNIRESLQSNNLFEFLGPCVVAQKPCDHALLQEGWRIEVLEEPDPLPILISIECAVVMAPSLNTAEENDKPVNVWQSIQLA